ncbi:uncharacterized protein [Gorilla gorilla gorilla]|uniref:uncharacterized protein n=1 Tax=Gorilla gorilla gorilla TaxID=9595 RepID=UPI0030088C22
MDVPAPPGRGWGGRGPGALTPRQERFSATTCFAWLWCGCCANRKASLIRSSLFSLPWLWDSVRTSPVRARLHPARPPAQRQSSPRRLLGFLVRGPQAPRESLPPWHSNNSRERRKSRETADRVGKWKSGACTARSRHPRTPPRSHACAEGRSISFRLEWGICEVGRKWCCGGNCGESRGAALLERPEACSAGPGRVAAAGLEVKDAFQESSIKIYHQLQPDI